MGMALRRLRLRLRHVLAVVAAAPLGLAIVLVVRTGFLPRVQKEGPAHGLVPLVPAWQLAGAARRLADALKLPTISYNMDHQEKKYILQMHTFLEKKFPLVHSAPCVKREVVNEYSLLYSVTGSVAAGGQLPYLLASHLDVVPADAAQWRFPPFGGHISNDTFLYGRGAIDDKAALMAILEALELLLRNQERPKRSFFIAFGHDEEISGKRGAQELAKSLRARGVQRLDFVLDEGFPLTQSLIPGTDNLVAVIGVSEKGSATVQLTVKGKPGHSSLAPRESAIGILAGAVARLENSPQPSLFGSGPEHETFTQLAPHVSFLYQVIYSNLWLFAGVLARHLEEQPVGNAFVRTTTAITMFHGGVKENVVPGGATAIVNHRVHPASSVSEAVAHDIRVIGDPRVTVTVRRSRDAPPISPSTAPQFHLVAASVRQVFNNAVVVPGVFIANTDTRWYLGFSENLYRFLPTIITWEDLQRYHGNNERISLLNYHQAINFFYRLIKNADQVDAAELANGLDGAQEL